MLWILALALGGVAVWYAAGGKLGAKRVECPSCDLYIHGVDMDPDAAVLCPHCRAYASVEDGKLVKTPADRVAREPVFCVELPQQVTWPEGCCVCGQPATRHVESRLEIEQAGSLGRDLAVGVASLGILKAVDRTTYTLAVPHCAEHADGARLYLPAEAEQLNLGVGFRSYPYFAQFAALNYMKPRSTSPFGPNAGGV